jgi:hypothetical protein
MTSEEMYSSKSTREGSMCKNYEKGQDKTPDMPKNLNVIVYGGI